jgi:hypothetical protein
MRQLALIVVGPMLAAASIGPVLRQDLHRLGRVWGVGLPVAVVSGVAAAKLTQYGLSINDALCSVVLANGAGSVGKQLDVVGASSMIPGAPALVTLLISCLLILGALALWLELLVRAAAVYVAVFFLPLTLACYVWPATVSIAKRSVEILVALILSKFVIVAVLTLGLSAVSHPSADSGLAGAVILLLAAFAPFVLLRLAPIVEVAAIAQLEGISRRPGHAASRAVGTAVAGPSHPLWQRLMASRSAQSKPPGSESVAAQPVATRSADYPLQAAAQSDARTRSARPDQAKSGG